MSDLERAIVMTEPRVLATIDGRSGYDGLIAMFRARIVELGTHMEAVDEVAGLPLRYTGKLLDLPTDKKVGNGNRTTVGRASLGPLLGALGIKLVAVIDDDADYKIKQGLNGLRKRGTKGSKLNDAGFRSGFENPRIARLARAKQITISTSTQRSTVASNAVAARWKSHVDLERKRLRQRLWVAEKRERLRRRKLRDQFMDAAQDTKRRSR